MYNNPFEPGSRNYEEWANGYSDAYHGKDADENNTWEAYFIGYDQCCEDVLTAP